MIGVCCYVCCVDVVDVIEMMIFFDSLSRRHLVFFVGCLTMMALFFLRFSLKNGYVLSGEMTAFYLFVPVQMLFF